MTAGATIFALMPLALGMSEGALISKGLAVVVIGGLIYLDAADPGGRADCI